MIMWTINPLYLKRSFLLHKIIYNKLKDIIAISTTNIDRVCIDLKILNHATLKRIFSV